MASESQILSNSLKFSRILSNSLEFSQILKFYISNFLEFSQILFKLSNSTSLILSNYYIAPPFFPNGTKSGFEVCFGAGAGGENTSQIQNNKVYVTLFLQESHS